MPLCIAMHVSGVPAPKGSSRAVLFGGRPHIVPNSSTANARQQRSWVKAVRDAAKEAVPSIELPFVNKALYVTITFHVPRPKTVKRLFPSTRPDIDKTARTTLDALTGIVFDDDSRIVDLTLSKRWAEPGREGATITVMEAA